ncbi:unnamed protein product [Closterium sp. Naga37s-1]|nr:unnamed protein product [Closterium sp. Naga37s-1]
MQARNRADPGPPTVTTAKVSLGQLWLLAECQPMVQLILEKAQVLLQGSPSGTYVDRAGEACLQHAAEIAALVGPVLDAPARGGAVASTLFLKTVSGRGARGGTARGRQEYLLVRGLVYLEVLVLCISAAGGGGVGNGRNPTPFPPHDTASSAKTHPHRSQPPPHSSTPFPTPPFPTPPAFPPLPRGDNQHGQLGRPEPSRDGSPAPVHGLEHLEVLLVVADWWRPSLPPASSSPLSTLSQLPHRCQPPHGQLGRPAPPQDGTPALVHGLEHLEVLLVVAGSQQGLVLCRALQGSEAALDPQEFDDTRVLNEERVSPATLPDPDASAPAAVPVPGAAGAVVGAGGAGGMGGGLGAAGEVAGAVAGGGGGSAGENWGERVGGGASAEEQGGTGGEGAVARDMWMKFGEEFKMLPRQGMDSSMRNPCWRVQAGGAAGSAGSGGNEGAAGPEVHCLPYFFIIGATRAGTQDLYRKLTSSIIPGIFPAAIPNPQWWDRNGARDFAWYVSLFDEAAQHMVNTGGSAVTGEASSTLLTSSGVVLRGHVDDRHTVPQLLHLVLPRSKFIVILRNPVDRFFSEFNLAAAVNPSPSVPRDFHKYHLIERRCWMNATLKAVDLTGPPRTTRKPLLQRVARVGRQKQVWLRAGPPSLAFGEVVGRRLLAEVKESKAAEQSWGGQQITHGGALTVE